MVESFFCIKEIDLFGHFYYHYRALFYFNLIKIDLNLQALSISLNFKFFIAFISFHNFRQVALFMFFNAYKIFNI
jgi:hypothetical protein